MGAKILNFSQIAKKARTTAGGANLGLQPTEKILSDSFYWALSEQRRQGFLAQPIALNFTDEEGVDCGDAYVAVFYEPQEKEALMIRVWSAKSIAQFNRIENYLELKRKAPKIIEQFQANALEMYRRRSLVC